MKSLRNLFLLLFVSIFIGAAFCNGTEEKKDDKITIRLLTRWAGKDSTAAYLKMVKEEFIKQNPNVIIQDDSVSDEGAYNNKLKIDIATGNVAGIIQFPAVAGLVDWAKAGVIMDVSTLFEDTTWSSGFIPGTTDIWNLEKYGVKGRFAIPFQMSPEVIWYNSALFKKAGIDKAPETMEELYVAIEKLKANGIVPWALGGADTWRGGHIFNNVIYRTVGIEYIKNIGSRKAKWTDPQIRPAFEIMKTLVNKGAFEEGFIGMSYDDELAAFFSSRAAMTCNGSWFMSDVVNSDIANDIEFMAFPYQTDKKQFKGDSILFPTGIQLSGTMTGAEKEMTIKFAKLFTSQEMTSKMVADFNILGARKDSDLSNPKISPLVKKMVTYMGTITNAGGDYSDYDPDIAILEKTRNAIQGLMLKDTAEQAAKASQDEIDKFEANK